MICNYNDKIVKPMHLVAMSNGNRYEGEFIDLRIDPNTIPQGKHWYHCRHDDDGDWVTPVTIEPRVIVNFCGTFITDKEIEFPDEYKTIYIDESWFE